MSLRVLESTSAHMLDVGQLLVDAIVAAIDANRFEEVEQVRRTLEPLGLDEAFSVELRLSGLGSECTSECWHDDLDLFVEGVV